jgi:predicted SprT family Zn-dependent metalloprotease
MESDWAPVLPEVQQLERRVAELLRLWRVPPGPGVSVGWNDRLRTTAGRAFMSEGRIELNPTLLAPVPDEIDVVLVHEAAHVAVWRLFGGGVPAHGRHWRALMRLAGLPPDVTHDLPIPRTANRPRRWLFLRLCLACGDRRIGRSVRYGMCECGVSDDYAVLRSTAGPVGLATLQGLSDADVRAQCGC